MDGPEQGLIRESVDLEHGAAASGQSPGKGVASGTPANSRRRRSKTVVIDGVRTVNYYRFNDHELDYITAPHKEAARCAAVAAFFLGLAVNSAYSFIFGKPNSEMLEGLAIAIGVFSAALFVYYGIRWYRLGGDAKGRLQKIKDEHDFT